VWALTVYATDSGMTPSAMAAVVSLAGGAMIANVVSVVLLVIETFMMRR
jgi:hypothetical protein